VRGRIVERIAAYRDEVDPHGRFLANVVGEPSAALLERLQSPGRPAAVLMPIVERDGTLEMLLTARASHLAHHPGQVAFPGGRIEPRDVDAAAAALREAEEEIGLEHREVQVVGTLGMHLTGTGFAVTPFVGFVGAAFVPRPDPAEVAAVFAVPLDFLFDPANCCISIRDRLGTRFRTYEYVWEDWHIWGATAAMIVSLRDIVMNKNEVL
jgi:8-oxo-dGTP pyrophosphatase MutT (NUDIX family)